MKKLLCLVGPTAVGKTDLALSLAPKLNAQIVSGDSMQIYREIEVGTAKPTILERQQIKHYLVDQRSIFDSYSVKDFVNEATTAITKIYQDDHFPFVVGGTGFYLYALINQLKLGETGDQKDNVSKKWQDYLAHYGAERLWQELDHSDPVAAAKIPWQNERRVLRALTVMTRTHHKFSDQQVQILPRYDTLIIGLNSERQRVYERINRRVDLMMAKGLLKEAAFIYSNREKEHQVLQAIGYKEFFPYFEGQASLDACVAELKKASRHYAKRQLTYFRHQLPIVWFDPLNDNHCEEKILNEIRRWQNA